MKSNRVSSTIDGNVEFVHSQYWCILTSQVSNKIINNSDNKVLILQWNKSNFVFFTFCFTLFYLILENNSTIGRKCCLPCFIWHFWRHVSLVLFRIVFKIEKFKDWILSFPIHKVFSMIWPRKRQVVQQEHNTRFLNDFSRSWDSTLYANPV